MRCAIIPPEKLATFTRSISPGLPRIRIAPVPIYAGAFAGSFAVSEGVLDSSPEWRAVADKARALLVSEGVEIHEIDTSDLINPKQPA